MKRKGSNTLAADTQHGDAASGEVVELHLPARSAYLSVLRTTAATLAARLNFTLDEIEDLRIAVDEASTLLLSSAAPDTRLSCWFELDGVMLRVRVMVDAVGTTSGAQPAAGSDSAAESGPATAQDSLAWMVLAALTDSASRLSTPPGQIAIELVKSATAAHAPARPHLRVATSADADNGATTGPDPAPNAGPNAAPNAGPNAGPHTEHGPDQRSPNASDRQP